MYTTKLQDLTMPLVGTFLGPKLGLHNKNDFLFDTVMGPAKILGVTDLAKQMEVIPVGSVVQVEYLGSGTTETQDGEQRTFYKAKVTVL
jgi:hypothetical protein